MPRLSLGGLLVAAGIVVILHTTYAVIKYRELLKLLQEEYQSLPANILAELAVGAAFMTLGAFMLAGSLRSIAASKLGRSTDIGSMRIDFVSFNLRSKAFPLDVPPLK
mmetsp:Transcript_35424/g.78607  ORF Transcript_35424/g.78607 Transcript_35424/m.78607 type:complete len:108 (-) Transcript_35424:788-1111(-)|eukprot:CAMPEP_0202901156 /NCGR_PEP_ID=MMETSP1392-20130828/13672_1 /ASSEMBLY_ACC=CAM_ASM_000868 /TAXON_ID=225041 /ORGANISM="Chlamydomonas chlamydogama, Strain SAG 11-48b" /LENGTH=107 /DNA_ID=CAMNT_0049587667 /DNA_START=75 /DNA_END=398 /DNA_ORIENTATION=+